MVVPAAVSGIVAAFILSASRAIGETMVVFIAGGAADSAAFSSNPLEGSLTMTAAMASLATGTEGVRGADLAVPSYFVGIVLFLLTLGLNMIANRFVPRARPTRAADHGTHHRHQQLPAPSRAARRAMRCGSRSDVKGRLFELALVACLGSLLVLGVLLTSVVTDGLPVYSGGAGSSSTAACRRRPTGPASPRASSGRSGSPCRWWCWRSPSASAPPCTSRSTPRNRLTTFIELNIRNLAGVPSVVYGLLGLAIFVEALGGFTSHDDANRRTLAAAGVTLAVLVMPIIVITTAEALRAVPQALREALRRGRDPVGGHPHPGPAYAAPGILTGALLSIARAVGEAAPLIVVGAVTGFFSQGAGLNVGNVTDPGHLTERFVALPTIVTNWAAEPEAQFKEANASATIIGMLVFVLLVNSLAIVLRNRFEKKRSS